MVIKGLKSIFKAQEKEVAGKFLAKYDWYVVRKIEKSTAIPTTITTYRDGVRTALRYKRKRKLMHALIQQKLVTLYGSKEDGTPNMTQYPKDPNS